MKAITRRIVITYAVAGILWITLTDVGFILVKGFKQNPAVIMGSVSACLFILVTSYILFKLIILHFSRLQDSEKHYRSYFEDNPTPMWTYNRKTLRFASVNNAAIANYGYSREEFLHMTILDIRPEQDAEKVKAAVNSFDFDYKNSGTWRHKRKDGSAMLVHINSHLSFPHGVPHVMVMASDVTKRIEAETQLMEANTALIKRNAILSEIAWSESHNVRRPLASILGLINIIRSSDEREEVNECFKYIELSANELDTMIKNINDQISDAVYKET